MWSSPYVYSTISTIKNLDPNGHDNFFSLGGHSLLAVAAIARMRREGLDIDVQGLFLMPTIGELAAAIEIREVRI